MPSDANKQLRERIDELESRATRIRGFATSDELQVEELRVYADALVQSAREMRDLLGPEAEPESDAPPAHG